MLVALALFFAIPLSIRVSNKIDETYKTSIEQTIEKANKISEEASALNEEEDKNAWQTITSTISNGLKAAKSYAQDLADRGSQLINNAIEGFAIMVVTSCVIPFAVLALSLWIIKQVFGFDIPLPKMGHGAKARRMFKNATESFRNRE